MLSSTKNLFSLAFLFSESKSSKILSALSLDLSLELSFKSSKIDKDTSWPFILLFFFSLAFAETFSVAGALLGFKVFVFVIFWTLLFFTSLALVFFISSALLFLSSLGFKVSPPVSTLFVLSSLFSLK